MNWPLDLHFQSPFMGYFLTLLPLFFYSILLAVRKRKAALQIFKESYPRSLLKSAAIDASYLLAYIFLVLALMDPVGFGKYSSDSLSAMGNTKSSTPALFLIDNSLSMNVRDAPRGKTRFALAKEIVDTALDKIDDLPLGLKSFNAHLQSLSPITSDMVYLNVILDTIETDEGGTDLLTVLSELENQLKVPRQIILISDGEDTTKFGQSEDVKQDRIEQILAKVKALKKENISIIPILVGSKQGGVIPDLLYENKPVISKPNFNLMTNIAKMSSGSYFEASHWSSLDLADELSEALTTSKHPTSQPIQELSREVTYTPLFQFPLFLSLLFLCLSQLINPAKKPKQSTLLE